MPAIERSGLLTTDLVAKPARATMATLSPVICRLYGLFLDRDREYSCAYFPKGTETLERGTPHHRRPDFIGVPIYTPGTAEPDGARTRQPNPPEMEHDDSTGPVQTINSRLSRAKHSSSRQEDISRPHHRSHRPEGIGPPRRYSPRQRAKLSFR